MASSKVVLSSVMTALVYITALILLVLGIGNYNSYVECDGNENPNCFTFTCRNRTETCDYYAYRCEGKGEARCSYDPTSVVKVNSLDGICAV